MVKPKGISNLAFLKLRVRKEGDAILLQKAADLARMKKRIRQANAVLVQEGDMDLLNKARAEASVKRQARQRDAVLRAQGDEDRLHQAIEKATKDQLRRSRYAVLRKAGDQIAIQRRQADAKRKRLAHPVHIRRPSIPAFKAPTFQRCYWQVV